MSEKQPHLSHETEHGNSEAHVESHTHHERLKQKVEKEATEAQKSTAHEDAEQAKRVVESIARSSEELKQRPEATQQNKLETPRHHANEQEVSFKQTMTRVRKRLNKVERPLSNVIHNPVVDKVSEVAGRTIARPSGMLGGAFFSLVGTSALLWITKHYGYEYNYLAVILLFAIGMIVGLALEATLRSKKLYKK